MLVVVRVLWVVARVLLCECYSIVKHTLVLWVFARVLLLTYYGDLRYL